MDKCVERLQLAGNAGWISMRLNRMPPHDDMVVELVDVDSYFDPENPGLYHLQAQKAIRSHLQETSAMQLSEVDLSSVDENDVSDDNSDDDMDGPSQVQSHRQNNTPSSTAEESRCVVCLASERNATIVHGSTGHVVCCLVCARILKARGDSCPICRLKIDLVIQHFHA
jgi:Zinc finger, C3HC4 type (RING finger)